MSVCYLGNGVGDLNIKAECNLLIQTYSIQDCWEYDTNTYNLAPNNALTQINGFTFANTGDWEAEWIVKYPQINNRVVLYPSDDSSVFLGVGVNYSSGRNSMIVYGYGNDKNVGAMTLNTEYTIKMVKEDNSIKVYANDNLIDTRTNISLLTTSNVNIGLRNWGSGTGTIRNIKVKPL